MEAPPSGSSTYKSQVLALAAVAAVAAAAGAVSIAIVHLSIHKHHTEDDASTARPSGDTDVDAQSEIASTAARKASLRATSVATWSNLLPGFLIRKPQEVRERERAAKRLAALARSSEAVESAAQVPLAQLSTLSSLAARSTLSTSSHIHSAKTDSTEDETTGAGAEQKFTASDLATLKVCTRSNGKRWTLGDGRGSAGEIYKALRGGVHPVAIREFRFDLSSEQQRGLQHLISTLTRCPDDNIAVTMGMVPIPKPGHGFYIASRFYEHGSLEDALGGPNYRSLLWYKKRSSRGGGRPSRGRTHERGAGRHIALGLARALHWLHATAGIVHQNLRPSKVMVGAGCDIALVDSGLARFMQVDYLAAKSNVGPFTWTAPEVMQGQPPKPSSDIYSFGVILWQLITGGNPVVDRRRDVKVGEHCPRAIADLLLQCLDGVPQARPSAAEIVGLLSCSSNQLPSALRPKEGSHPPIGHPILGGKQTVWTAIQKWVLTTYGSREAMDAAGYKPCSVDDILDHREWDEYKLYVDSLRENLEKPDVQTPGSPSYKRLLDLVSVFGWALSTKLAGTAEQVRMLRFAQMESLDSLDALGVHSPTNAGSEADIGSVRSDSATSQALVEGSCKARSQAGQSVRVASGGSGSLCAGSGSAASTSTDTTVLHYKIVEAIDLTADQVQAIVWTREQFMAGQDALVKERTQLVRLLHDFATGRPVNEEDALAASGALRANIMEEGRRLHRYSMGLMFELLSPWQYARADVMAFPGFTGPVQLCDIVAEMAAADPPKHGRRKKATYQPVVLGGYENLRFSPGNRIET